MPEYTIDIESTPTGLAESETVARLQSDLEAYVDVRAPATSVHTESGIYAATFQLDAADAAAAAARAARVFSESLIRIGVPAIAAANRLVVEPTDAVAAA